MADQVQIRRGTATQHNSFTGAIGEVTYVTDTKTLRTHDGSTAGGNELTSNTATQTLTNKTLTAPTINGVVGGTTTSQTITALTTTTINGVAATDQAVSTTSSPTFVGVSLSGNMTNTGQPAFLAYNSATDLNVTGNGTSATVDFDTEVFDQGSDFATDTFTAPIAGRYLLATTVRFAGLTAAATDYSLTIVTSNRTYSLAEDNFAEVGTYSVSISTVADMDASDTAFVRLIVNGEASDVVGISGGAQCQTYFSGCLLA